MTNYLQITFYLRPTQLNPNRGAVYVRIRVNKQRTVLGSVSSVAGLDLPKSILIDCANWQKDTQRVNAADAQAVTINSCIEECERKLKRLYAKHEGEELAMNVGGVKTALRNGGRIQLSLPDLMERFLVEKALLPTHKASTLDTYRFKFVPLRAFLKAEGKLDAPAVEFTPGTLKRYRNYLMSVRGNSERTADKTCQTVKTLLIWGAESELITKNPLLFVPIRIDRTPNLECLNQAEVAQMREAKLTPALRGAADCLEFSCYTGLAYQDMHRLSPNAIRLVEGKRCLVGNRLKTGTEYCIPLSLPVQALMARYGGQFPPLPKLDDYNTLLRQLMLILGIDKHITSHTGRKTFADWCINELGMSEEATIVAMGQKDTRELTPYRKTRPKRLLSEFPSALLAAPQPPPAEPAASLSAPANRTSPFSAIYKAS